MAKRKENIIKRGLIGKLKSYEETVLNQIRRIPFKHEYFQVTQTMLKLVNVKCTQAFGSLQALSFF